MRDAGLALLGLLGTVAFVWYRGTVGDYPQEVAPAVEALARGDLREAVERQPAVAGPVSVILRAPFVAITRALGGGDVDAYRVGAVACMAAAVFLAVALVLWFPSARRPRGFALLVMLLAVATPVAADAVELGHPEEVLTAALAVGAVAAGARGRIVWAAVLLGLAVASKHWALLAIGPTILAVGWARSQRVAAAVCGIAAALILPLVLVDPDRFEAATRAAASAPREPLFLSWWYLLGRDLPAWLPQLTKPAIVLSAIPLTLLVFRRGAGAAGALPLLALLFLIRCVLDTQTQSYYLLPLVLALLAWDVQLRRVVPSATLVVVGLLVVTNSFAPYLGSYTASVFYFVWTVALAAYLLVVLTRRVDPVRDALEHESSRTLESPA